MKRRFGLAAAWSMCAIIVDCPVATSQPVSAEYQVKAAFLYNFAKFVEWPPQAFRSPDSPFMICLAGDPFEGVLDRTVQGELLDRRPLMVRRIMPAEDLRGCQMIYVAPNERRSEEIIAAAANAPILTVGETDDFINEGGIIHFVKSGSRIHFQINPDAAERVSLRVSARLLRLADIVRPRQRAGVIR